MKEKIDFVVVTSDGYTDLIDGFVFFANKYASNVNFHFYFALENKIMTSFDRYEFITTMKKSWSERLFHVLKSINVDYIYLIPEDFFFCHHADIESLQKIIDFANNNKVDFICKSETNNSEQILISNQVIEFYKNNDIQNDLSSLYASAGYYNRIFLMSILRRNENIWEFESNTGYRVNPFTSLNYRFLYKGNPFGLYPPGIIYRGKLTTEGKKLLYDNDYHLHWQEKKRYVITEEDNLFSRLIRIPYRIIKRLLNIHFNKMS
jgi:hypothetical protein